MKSRNFWKWTLGLSLSALPLAGGCLQESSSPPVSTAAITTAAPEVVYQAAPAEPVSEAATADYVAASDAGAPPLTNLVEAAVEPITTNLPAPPKANLTSAAAELVRLANSGVDESVMLAYVTNSASTFNLGAEEIIYMNDLGVPSGVVTAMIQRDQALKAAGDAAMAASAEANAPQLPPAPEQPAGTGGHVAPQATAPLTYQAEAVAPPPETDVTTATFYESMAPYGSWIYVSGYGRCWRPTIAAVNTGWAPYFDGGRWVYTDFGWYWVSDYSWGWAPFHYGRWFRHASWGWCWAPDTVWGPSWVSWRYSDAYCGWAPLPPGAYFTFGIGLTYHGHHCHDWHDMGLGPHHGHFVAWRDFDRHGLRRHAVGDRERTTIYRNTTVVNNTIVNNNTVINRGVPRDRVAAATRRDIRPVTLRETTSVSGGRSGGRAEQLRGDTLTVYRPVTPQANRNVARTAGTGSSHSRPELGNRTSSVDAGNTGNSGARESRPVAGQTRTGTTVNRNLAQPGGRSTQSMQSPAETRVAPVTRQNTPGTANNAARPVPSSTRSPEAAPNRAPTATRAPQPAPTVTRAPQPAPSQAPVRQEPAQSRPNYQAPSRAPAQAPRSALAPSSRPVAPTYTAPQRSYTTPSSTTPQRLQTPASTPRQAPAMAAQVPRYTPQAQRTYNVAPSYSRSTPSYSPAPSYSRPAPSVAQAPRYSAPSAPAVSTPRASSPAPSASRSDSGGGRSNGRQR